MSDIIRFDKKDRSTFPYWFAHWCAFQMTALNMGVWKPKYLLHDIEKPWLKLFWDYSKVQKWHNEHWAHHLIYVLNGGTGDWEQMIIDWECCRFTKKQCPLDAAGEYKRLFETVENFIETYKPTDDKICNYIKDNNLSLYTCVTRLRYAYINLHDTFNKLGIKHEYKENIFENFVKHNC